MSQSRDTRLALRQAEDMTKRICTGCDGSGTRTDPNTGKKVDCWVCGGSGEVNW